MVQNVPAKGRRAGPAAAGRSLLRDLKTLARFVSVYCTRRHVDAPKSPVSLKGCDLRGITANPVDLPGLRKAARARVGQAHVLSAESQARLQTVSEPLLSRHLPRKDAGGHAFFRSKAGSVRQGRLPAPPPAVACKRRWVSRMACAAAPHQGARPRRSSSLFTFRARE